MTIAKYIAVVAGCGPGIGAATCIEFAKLPSYAVAMVGRDTDFMGTVSKQINTEGGNVSSSLDCQDRTLIPSPACSVSKNTQLKNVLVSSTIFTKRSLMLLSKLEYGTQLDGPVYHGKKQNRQISNLAFELISSLRSTTPKKCQNISSNMDNMVRCSLLVQHPLHAEEMNSPSLQLERVVFEQ